MSEFEEFVRSQGFNGDFQRGGNGQYKSDLLHFMEKAFMHQQAKIDLIEKELTETQAFLNKQNHIKQAKIDELQARIGGARGHVDHIYNVLGDDPDLAKLLDEMVRILKGNKDEN